MIKNVIFDIGRVMIEFNWEEFLCGLFDPETAKTVSDAMWGTAAWDELDRNVLPMEDVIKLFIANAPDYAPQIREAMRRLGDCAKMMLYAIGWVEELKAQGYRVFYLSNYFPYLMQERPDVLEFTKHMDGGVFSWQEKLIKPDPAIFRRFCEKFSLDPRECLFTDDRAENIDGAISVGMHAILFRSPAQFAAQLREVLLCHS